MEPSSTKHALTQKCELSKPIGCPRCGHYVALSQSGLYQASGSWSEVRLVAVKRTQVKSSEVDIERAVGVRKQADTLPPQDFR